METALESDYSDEPSYPQDLSRHLEKFHNDGIDTLVEKWWDFYFQKQHLVKHIEKFKYLLKHQIEYYYLDGLDELASRNLGKTRRYNPTRILTIEAAREEFKELIYDGEEEGMGYVEKLQYWVNKILE